jgi:iron complex outermembrane receptor protein
MRSILFIFLGLLASNLTAQTADLWGVVRDQKTKQPLPNIKVFVPSAFQSAMTNEKGEYRLENLPLGELRIVIEADEYQPYEASLALDERGADMDLYLKAGVRVVEEVLITAIKATERTATAFTTLGKTEIRKANYGQDLPFLLDQTPSIVVNSDAGAGIGYTGMRIRGTDQTRINVTINGIPLNDPESHGVFWVNMPDFASSVNNIQVQRGVGTSTNGAAAFGASVNIQTTTLNYEPYAEVGLSRGSFNTAKNTLSVGTGLIKERFSFDARLSSITSDGWVDRASSDLRSYFLTGAYYGDKSLLKFNIFSGREQTYQSWWGIPESFLDDPVLRRSNYYTYENEIDNYGQDHYQLFYAYEPSKKFNLNLAGHYTKGAGYFEQYRDGEDLGDYGFSPLFLIQGTDTITNTDLIRRRWLDNDFYGFTYSANYNPLSSLQLTLGGGWNEYRGDHFGEVIWAQYAGPTQIRDRYYDNTARKRDFNSYFKALYQMGSRLTAFVDLQLRTIDYVFGDSTLVNPGIDNDQRSIQGNANYVFFNPKFGLTFSLNTKSQLYASWGVSNREPVRNDFIDAFEGQTPEHETLRNLETGYRLNTDRLQFNANFYFMDYTNQLVPNGRLNDVGSALRENVADSYRAGIELVGQGVVNRWLSLGANATFSQNKIRSFEETIYDYDDPNVGIIVNTFANTDIAFSPSVIAGANIVLSPFKNLEVSWLHKYVGRQYLDNTQNVNRSLDPFYVSHLRAQYDWTPEWAKLIRLGLQLNNLLDAQYEPNGYTFSYKAGGEVITETFITRRRAATSWPV